MPTLFKYALLACAAVSVTACEDYERPVQGQMPLVVEGFIEEGANPVVIVTHALDLTGDSLNLDACIEKWGRVSIYDGDKRHILSGRINDNYTPSFIFTSNRLRGEQGHTYRLFIETQTDTVEAVSTITPAPKIARLEAVPSEESDTLFSIKAYLEGLSPDGYCKFFTRRIGKEKRDYASFLGTFAVSEYNPGSGWTVTRGITYHAMDNDGFSHYFRRGEAVNVKVCSLESAVFDFWKVYERNVSMSNNLMFSFSENCPTNLRSLGSRGVAPLGYWAAYGASSRIIELE